MRLVLAGLSHKTASIAIREQVSLSGEQVSQSLQVLSSKWDIDEALLLSTCNRSELYVVADGCTPPAAQRMFADLHGCPSDVLDGHVYVLEDLEAAEHLFKVASGVDSMVFGETEIVGQLKQSLDCAREAGMATRVLLRLGDRALAVGKRVRTETSVDRGCMSVASVAVGLAKQIFDDLGRARILLLGAGETGSLVARRMIENGARHVMVTSRTARRAAELAQRFGVEAIGFEEFPEELGRADIVISCTSAPHHLITVERVTAAQSGHHHRPMFLIDLAVPRDIDPAVRQLNDVYLYDIDDLEELSREREEQRRCELPRVEALVAEEARDFLAWAKSLEAVPLMLAIRHRAEEAREDEVKQLLETCPELTVRERKHLHLATKRLVRRLLDGPLDNLRTLAHGGDGSANLDVAKILFGVDACEVPEVAEPETQGVVESG